MTLEEKMKMEKLVKEKVQARTPHSITTTDSPIFKVQTVKEPKDIAMGIKKFKNESGQWELRIIEIPNGVELRILACELQEGTTPFRYLHHDVFMNNTEMVYVEGNLGPKVEVETIDGKLFTEEVALNTAINAAGQDVVDSIAGMDGGALQSLVKALPKEKMFEMIETLYSDEPFEMPPLQPESKNLVKFIPSAIQTDNTIVNMTGPELTLMLGNDVAAPFQVYDHEIGIQVLLDQEQYPNIVLPEGPHYMFQNGYIMSAVLLNQYVTNLLYSNDSGQTWFSAVGAKENKNVSGNVENA